MRIEKSLIKKKNLSNFVRDVATVNVKAEDINGRSHVAFS